MNNVPKNPQPTSPVSVDRVIVQVQDFLLDKLPWLDHAFGRAQKLVALKDKKRHSYPGVHIKNQHYINVFPNKKFGNFTFFILEDPQEINFERNQFGQIKVKYGLVFWMNLDQIFTGATERNSELIKAYIMGLLTRDLRIVDSRMSITQVYEQAENIYKNFSIDEIESQFLMHPYYGFRLEGFLSFYENCQPNILISNDEILISNNEILIS